MSASEVAIWVDQTNRFLRQVKGVIHVGANSGQERKLYAGHALPVVWVEPIPEVYNRLQTNLADYPKQQGFNYLITDVDGQDYPFHISNNSGQSSSIYDLKEHSNLWPDVYYLASTRMQSTRLDTMFQREGLNISDYDTLVMDTQGSELLVLQGMGALLDGIKWIRTEAADCEMYEGSCQIKDLDEFLIPKGFQRVQTDRGKWLPGLGGCYELLYVKKIII